MQPKRLFITGIPTAGKSWAGNLIATELGAIHVEIDDMRAEFQHDRRYRDAANFFLNQNEKEYYENTTHKEQWDNVVRQSESLWPALFEKIKSYEKEPRPVVFEGVNLIPSLMHKDFPHMKGIVLLGPSFEKTLERNHQSPRWGNTEELQHIEAEAFFYGERPRYMEEGEKYGYKICDTATEAFNLTKEIWSL